MARSAASRATPEERESFKSLATEMRRASTERDDLGFMRLDQAFNQLVATAARNEFAEKSIALMAGHSRRFWFMHNQHVEDLDVTAEAHARLAEAIGDADAEGATSACEELMDHIEAITRSAVDW